MSELAPEPGPFLTLTPFGPGGRRASAVRALAFVQIPEIPAGFAPFEPQGPFLEHVGPVLVRDDDGGGRVFGLLVEERHTNHRGTVQGGLLSTFVDFALGRAIEADADDGKDRATVSLTVDFLKPAKPGDWIETRTRVERVGGTLSFADCSLTVDGREIVRGRAVWVVAS